MEIKGILAYLTGEEELLLGVQSPVEVRTIDVASSKRALEARHQTSLDQRSVDDDQFERRQGGSSIDNALRLMDDRQKLRDIEAQIEEFKLHGPA